MCYTMTMKGSSLIMLVSALLAAAAAGATAPGAAVMQQGFQPPTLSHTQRVLLQGVRQNTSSSDVALAAPAPAPAAAEAAVQPGNSSAVLPGVAAAPVAAAMAAPAEAQFPTCCQSLLTPSILSQLNATSLASLQLPVLIINTNGGNMTAQKNRVQGSICICGKPMGGVESYDWFPVKVGARGSTSVVDFTRKSYAVTVEKHDTGNNTTSKQVKFLGLPKGKEWFLYAPEGDVAIIRNWLAYSLWRQTGRWGPRTEWAEVFVIASEAGPIAWPEDYYGLYMGGEKIWIDNKRIDIKTYDPLTDPTGGFIFRNEHGKVKNVPQFSTLATSQIILIDEPRSNVSDTSLAYLTQYFNNFEHQLVQPGLAEYAAYVTPDSLVDWFLANEVIKSANDGYRGSVYFWKDADSACAAAGSALNSTMASAAAALQGNSTVAAAAAPTPAAALPGMGRRLLTPVAAASRTLQSKNPKAAASAPSYCLNGKARVVMGPVWDAAKAMGLCCGYPVEGYQNAGVGSGSSGGSAISPEGWLFNICAEPQRCKIDPLNGLAQWYIALWRNQGFRAQTLARYQALRRSSWSDAWYLHEIDTQARTIQPAISRNYQRWAVAFAHDVVQLPPGMDGASGWNASVAALRAWIPARLHWLDLEMAKEAGAAPADNSTGAAAAAGNATAATAAGGALVPVAGKR